MFYALAADVQGSGGARNSSRKFRRIFADSVRIRGPDAQCPRGYGRARIRIGATENGEIAAISHESWSGDVADGKPDGAVHQTRMLYAGAHRMTATRLAVLDLPEANAMRAPGEATGMMALEIAMDEMAEKLRLDPVEFRIRNDTQIVPDHPSEPSADDPQARKSDHPETPGVPVFLLGIAGVRIFDSRR
jgi:hypothetical protein